MSSSIPNLSISFTVSRTIAWEDDAPAAFGLNILLIISITPSMAVDVTIISSNALAYFLITLRRRLLTSSYMGGTLRIFSPARSDSLKYVILWRTMYMTCFSTNNLYLKF